MSHDHGMSSTMDGSTNSTSSGPGMKMYFHATIPSTDAVLFYTWIPRSPQAMFGVSLALFVLAVGSRFLMGVQRAGERRWARRGRGRGRGGCGDVDDEDGEVGGCGGMTTDDAATPRLTTTTSSNSSSSNSMMKFETDLENPSPELLSQPQSQPQSQQRQCHPRQQPQPQPRRGCSCACTPSIHPSPSQRLTPSRSTQSGNEEKSQGHSQVHTLLSPGSANPNPNPSPRRLRTRKRRSASTVPFVWGTELSRAGLEMLNSAIHYILMLVIMTFNVWFFVAIVLGIGFGELLFGRYARGVGRGD